jgi:hypothetical protein
MNKALNNMDSSSKNVLIEGYFPRVVAPSVGKIIELYKQLKGDAESINFNELTSAISTTHGLDKVLFNSRFVLHQAY